MTDCTEQNRAACAPELAVHLRSTTREIQRSEAILAGCLGQLQAPLSCTPARCALVRGSQCYSLSKQEAEACLSMDSVRSGELSTWQWLQAWLQYRPTLSCSTLAVPRVSAATPSACQ